MTRSTNSGRNNALSWIRLQQHWTSCKGVTVVMWLYYQPLNSWCQGQLPWTTPSQGWQLAFQMSLGRYAYIPKPLIFLQIYLGRFDALHSPWTEGTDVTAIFAFKAVSIMIKTIVVKIMIFTTTAKKRLKQIRGSINGRQHNYIYDIDRT